MSASRAAPVARRWVPVAEVLAFVAAVLFHIWVVKPHAGALGRTFSLLVIATFAAAVYQTRGDNVRRIGLRLDTLAGALWIVIPPTLVAGALLVGAGAFLGTLNASPGLVAAFAFYLLWGLVQQYALQGVVLLRLEEAGAGRLGPPSAAALFALVHLPNPLLMAVTFVAGWAWCHAFRRRPNLLVLAVSHGWLATLLFVALPPAATGGLRIGPDYLHFVATHSMALL